VFGLPSLGSLLLGIPGLLVAFVLHEFAHALVADRLGDPTPRYRGRLTLNPLAHLDWIGLIMLWIFRFGWAKPVPVNPHNLRGGPRVGMMWVALAGPAMNVLLAALSLLAYGRLAQAGGGGLLGTLLVFSVIYNIYLAAFNILPVPPLDGSRVAAALSNDLAQLMDRLEHFGWVILILLIWTGWINPILGWLVGGLSLVLGRVTGVPVLF
jgi:Zn-dependent protease